MKVGIFHPGTQHSWQTALAFQERGLLSWYATSVFYDPSRWPYKLDQYAPLAISQRLNREFRRRHNASLDPRKVRQFGLWEWSETLLRRCGRHRLAGRFNDWGNRAFGRQVIRLIEREPVDVLWGFDTASLEVFSWACKRGIFCVLDQTIGHPASQNRVMLREQHLHPEFFASCYQPHSSKSIERQNEEVTEADLVVTGSEFCARTMLENGCPPQKVRVVPYGYDESAFALESPPPKGGRRGPLRCLFVGEIGPRKGAAYLLQAVAQLPVERFELTLVGRQTIPASTFAQYAARVRHVPQVPRAEVVRYFTEAECFVFPSLFEGSAIVLYEACGAGLGIIATERCGDGVQPGVNGLVLNPISVTGLIQSLTQVLEQNDLLDSWRRASWTRRGDRTWAKYRARVCEVVAHG